MAFRLLLWPHLMSIKNSLTKGAVIKRIPFTLMGLVFWFALYMGAYKGIQFIRGIELFGEVISARLISTVFFSLMGFLFLSNLITAISAFYLSRDLPLLRALPLKEGDIMAVKTVHTVVGSSWMVLSFIPPVLIAFGVAYNAPLSYYPVVFLSFFLFTLITAGMGISIAHILTALFPAKKLRNAFLFAGLLLFVLAYLALRSSVPSSFENPLDIIKALTFDADFPLMPAYWISDITMSMLKGKSPDMLHLSLLFTNGVFLLMVSLAAGERLYGRNIERLTSGKESKPGLTVSGSFYPGARFAFLYKDSRLFVRDTAQWSQLVIILSLVFIYVYNFKSLPVEAVMEAAPFMKELLVLLNILLSGMVLAAVSARFLYSSVSLEGQAFWIARAAPLDMKRLLYGKFLYGALPLGALAVTIVAITNLFIGVGWIAMSVSLATVLVLSISIGGLGTGLGAIYPKFEYETIASVSMSLGGMAFMISAFVLVLVTVLFEAWPLYAYYKTGIFPTAKAAASATAVLAINFIAFYLPMKIGGGKLRTIEL